MKHVKESNLCTSICTQNKQVENAPDYDAFFSFVNWYIVPKIILYKSSFRGIRELLNSQITGFLSKGEGSDELVDS